MRDNAERLMVIGNLKKQVAGEIVRERQMLGVSQGAFAKMAETTQGDISAIETGDLRRFTLDRLCWVLCALGHDVEFHVC